MTEDLHSLRRDYKLAELKREDLCADPIEQFDLWLKQVIDAGIKDPTAMVVATVSADGQPSLRTVLLKQVDQAGFVFFTNYASRKAEEIAANPKVGLLFPWHFMDRQVKVCGTATKVSALESLQYFASRPVESQLAAWASRQSKAITSKQLLLGQLERMKAKFAHGHIPLPDFWGGFRVVPHEIEFWQGGVSRMHDRFQYRLDDKGEWQIERLMP
ncbi:pyridoxamine 5'-phosphate oxidase [Halioxenophilus sp. WMMB6]|uniref:pyridoxamine 5'-phosphate oxidase n=1 Tax=Halioxenophilus sp. WMMB6 TaxID=3073815 RepID=UPI00295F4F24|nr:pyridoxamine 5'-phosphate oxidase [Halioxenophilus sp. WMMB6]